MSAPQGDQSLKSGFVSAGRGVDTHLIVRTVCWIVSPGVQSLVDGRMLN